MPKKTKRQKILARARSRTEGGPGKLSPDGAPAKSANAGVAEAVDLSSKTSPPGGGLTFSSTTSQFFAEDIRRSLIVTAIICGLIICLYIAVRANALPLIPQG